MVWCGGGSPGRALWQTPSGRWRAAQGPTTKTPSARADNTGATRLFEEELKEIRGDEARKRREADERKSAVLLSHRPAVV